MTARRSRMALISFVVVALTAAVVLLLLVPAIDPQYLSPERDAFRGLSGLAGLVLGLVVVIPILAIASALRGDPGEILAGFLGTVVGVAGVIAVSDRVMAAGEPWVRTLGYLVTGALSAAVPVGLTFLVLGGITGAIVRSRRRPMEPVSWATAEAATAAEPERPSASL